MSNIDYKKKYIKYKNKYLSGNSDDENLLDKLSNEEIFNMILEEYLTKQYLSTIKDLFEVASEETEIFDSSKDNIIPELKKLKTNIDEKKLAIEEIISQHKKTENEMLSSNNIDDFISDINDDYFVEFCRKKLEDCEYANKNATKKSEIVSFDVEYNKPYLYNVALYYYLYKLENDYIGTKKMMTVKSIEPNIKIFEFLKTF